MPSETAVCSRAYSVNDDNLYGDCLPWITGASCFDLDNERFQLHCGKSIYFRTW